MSALFVLLLMIFLHVIDDYVLQAPCLCNLKQKSFWEKNAPEDKYKHDYIVALLMHAFSWSFMIMLPIAFALSFEVGWGYLFFILLNTGLHALIDDIKANKKFINLWVDQSCHLVQIAGTFALYLLGGFIC